LVTVFDLSGPYLADGLAIAPATTGGLDFASLDPVAPLDLNARGGDRDARLFLDDYPLLCASPDSARCQ
jgi:hypothetical protein